MPHSEASRTTLKPILESVSNLRQREHKLFILNRIEHVGSHHRSMGILVAGRFDVWDAVPAKGGDEI